MKIGTRIAILATSVTAGAGGLLNLGISGSNGIASDAVSMPSSSFSAQVAERLFPSGAPVVVICSGTPENSSDFVAGQALASRFGGPLLVSQNSKTLGPAANDALAMMTVPTVEHVTQSSPYEPQPFQPLAGKPMVYLVGSPDALSGSLAAGLSSQGYVVQRITSSDSKQLLAKVQSMVAPAMPSASNQAAFPSTWTSYAGGQSHNSVFSVSSDAPGWTKSGVSWNFAEAAAVPLSSKTYADQNELGTRGAPVKMTQNLGNAVGVTAVGGVIYAESDDYHLYAIDAQTGQQLWESSSLVNSLMGNPIVANGMVYVTAGDTGFPFSQLLKFFLSNGKFALTRGLMYSAIYAFDQQTGRMVWRQDFHGEAMASPIAIGSTVYEPTGGGHLWAFDGATGAVLRKTVMGTVSGSGGFDSMSSPNSWTDTSSGNTEVLVGTSDPNNVVAVDSATGLVAWKQPVSATYGSVNYVKGPDLSGTYTTGTYTNHPISVFNTGMGDNSPAVDQAKGLVFQDSVVNFLAGTVNLAVYGMDAKTGAVSWVTELGRAAAPPAYKSGMIMVDSTSNTIFVGSPVTSTLYALDETTGVVKWEFTYSNAGPAGAGRGGVVLYGGVLWSASGPNIYAIDPATGKALAPPYVPGGRFGIVNPVIVGGTMYLDNSYDWIQAIPLKTILPNFTIPMS